MFNYDNLAANLPDVLAKDKDSNNYKLLLMKKRMHDRIMQIHADVAKCMDINNCTDATLDEWGKKYQLLRGTSTNEQYLLRIKAKRGQNMCDGTHESIVNSLAYLLSCDKTKIQIRNGENENSVDIVNIPLDVLTMAEFEPEEITEIINSLLPVGVTLGSINYGGTLKLSEIGAEQSAETGLSDIDGTTGGTLGMIGGN